MPNRGQKLLLVGCGKMGSALLRGILAANLVDEVVVVEPSPEPDEFRSIQKLSWKNTPDTLADEGAPDVILIAVKPQYMAEVLPAYARYKNAVFLSIAAGTTLARLSEILQNPTAAIIRTMPNLPASIGQGMTVAVANAHATAEQKKSCDRLLQAVGQTAWVEDEAMLDAVTALSGSGPAYVFALCEAMAAAGETLGLPPDMAQKLARQTIVGSGALMNALPDSARDLRQAVTSPKGTTEAAMVQLLSDDGLIQLMQKTMRAAAARAKELAQ